VKGSSRSSGFVQKCVKILGEQETNEAVKFKSSTSLSDSTSRSTPTSASTSAHSGRHLNDDFLMIGDLNNSQSGNSHADGSGSGALAMGTEREEGGVALEEAKPKLKEPKHYAVMLHNDDYTTMEFVTEVLLKYFHKSGEEAVQIMLKVHHQGKGVAGIYTYQIAETKVAQVDAHAKEKGFPLKCTVEET
jgi:ATP-dependent Clp protease adaptor protein ClpS